MAPAELFGESLSACPACGTSGLQPWLRQEIAGIAFTLDKCPACGTGCLNPPPAPTYLKSLYGSTGHGAKSLTSFEAVLAAEREFPNSTVDAASMVRYAQKLLGPGHAGERLALDIGSGYGFFSKAALNQGFSVTAVNPAGLENRIFRQLNGFEPVPQFFEEVDWGARKFDLVILSQILEHLLDPLRVLVKIKNLLKPAGVAAIAVPNVDAILIKILRSQSSFLGLPEHVIHFSRKGLNAVLQRAGFAVKHHRYYSRIPYYAISNRLNLQGTPRKLVNHCFRICQWLPLTVCNWAGLGLFQNAWAAPQD